jgi:ATP-dependent helicase HrpA
MSLHYKPLGNWRELKDQLLSAAVDRALYRDVDEIRTRDVFVAVANDGWRRLTVAARELNDAAREILARYHDIGLALSRPFPPMLLSPVQEMRDQLSGLICKQFLQSTPPQWLEHLPRYLRALSVRLEKLLNAGLRRDEEVAAQIRPIWRAYIDRRASHAARGIIDLQLQQLRWMIEELRVSLYAQRLKTSLPVSVQRLEKQLSLVGP